MTESGMSSPERSAERSSESHAERAEQPAAATPNPMTGAAGATLRPTWAVTSALLATTVLGGVTMTATAPTATAQGGGQGGGHPERQRRGEGPEFRHMRPMQFDISAGLLSDALAAFGKATGMTVQTAEGVKADLRTDGVHGEFAPSFALRQLLNGSGLTYGMLNSRTILVRPAGSQHQQLESMDIVTIPKPTVSSPKYTAPLRDVPQTIMIVPQSVIQAQAATSLRDVIRNVPGITMNAGEGGNAPGDKFNIRGFSAASDMFVDGVRDMSTYSRDAYNIEQIEVSKGPNSAVAGRGSTGGTINMVTKAPQMHDSRAATIALGSADQRRATLDVNQTLAAIGEPTVAFRLNAMTSQGGVPGNEVIHNKSWGIAPSLTIGLGTPTQIGILYNRSGQNNIPAYGIETFAGVPKYDTRKYYGLRSLDFERVAANQFTVRLDHDFGFMQLRNQSIRGRSNSDRIVTSAVPVLTNPANPDTARRSPKSHINDNTIFTNQTNLTTSFRTGMISHSVVAGFEYAREHSMWGRHAITGTPPAIRNLNNPTEDADFHATLAATVTRKVRATSMGAYAFETMRVGEYVEVNGGLRWDQYTPIYQDSASKATGFKAANSRAITGRAGLVVKPVEAGSIYASYGTSFNPSNENLSGDALNASSSLPPEKSRNYEVGSKWDLFKQRLSATVALFRTEKVNARTPDPVNTGVTILAGKQRVQGAEVGLVGNITQDWNVMAGYSTMDSKYLESGTASQVGTPFTNVPKQSGNLWTTYKPTENLTVGGGARYMDKRLLRYTDTLQVYVPSYQTYDAMASYQFNPSIGLQLNIYNLTDKLYYDSGRMWVPAPGRAVTVTTSMKF